MNENVLQLGISVAAATAVLLGAQVPAPLHENEIPIDTALVRRLIERALPSWAGLPISPMPTSGSTNALFRLGTDLLVRLPRQPGGSATIRKEATWPPYLAPALPVAVPEVVGVFGPDAGYPEHWAVVRRLAGAHPEIVDPTTPVHPRRQQLAVDLAGLVTALRTVPVPDTALGDAELRWYRGEPLATMDASIRDNLARCRALGDFGFDLDAAQRVWDDAMALPGVHDRVHPRWYHGDLAAENLLVRDGRLAAVLDFGALAIGDPCVDLIAAWEVLDRPAREVFRREAGVDDPTWLRGRAWALGLALGVWYYWATMPDRRASRVAVGRNVLADAG
ncbi:MAG TPA: aminoglycoside phosphotransferase family protein [Jatrophihabitans sp.]|jgi:aminoglycoside phosphotransferase (APT) family kinase protein